VLALAVLFDNTISSNHGFCYVEVSLYAGFVFGSQEKKIESMSMEKIMAVDFFGSTPLDRRPLGSMG